MDEVRRETLNLLFEEALALPISARAAFVEDACGTNAELRQELASLIDAYEASTGFFEELADRVVKPALDGVADSTGLPPAERGADAGLRSRGAHELSTGETVAHYEILARVRGGGMGEVYRARDSRLGRAVALKFLPPELSADPSARARLLAEAKAASALDHPNIGVVYEMAQSDGGRPFIAMAWYEGETLKARLGRGHLSVEEAVQLAVQLGEALGAAHRAGIVHRDVKPANVLITAEGVAKLVDFGIAKRHGAELTREGATLGTVAYMSPEQTRGEALDGRTDLWSLGVVLYEMLARRRPFEAEHEQALVYAIRHDEPAPLVELCPELPRELAAVVTTCLEKIPARRYGRAGDVVEALHTVAMKVGLAGRTGRAGRDSGGPRRDRALPAGVPGRRRAAVAGGLIALLSVAAAGYLGLRGPGVSGGDGSTEPDVSASSVAVFPFTVRGNPDLAYLREGMAMLLATKLYGAGDLRTVDPNALLRMAGEADFLDPIAASGLAAQMGAGLFVLGNAVEADGRLYLDASLYATGAPHTTLVRAPVEGATDQSFALVDALAIELLAGRVRQPAGLGRAADLTTHSLPAFLAFLQGETEWRAYRIGPAMEAYRQAVREDSTFALAHLRIASMGWSPGRHLTRPSVEAALRHRDRLSPRDRLFLNAQAAFLRAPLELEERIRALTVQYPDDAEGWSMLGELLFHANPHRGRPRTEAREALERALALDPGVFEPSIHLLDIAMIERRHEDVLEKIGPTDRESAPSARASDLAARFALGPEAVRQQILDEVPLAADDLRGWMLLQGVVEELPVLLRAMLDLQREQPFPIQGAPPWRQGLLFGRLGETLARIRELDHDPSSADPADEGFRLSLEARVALLPYLDPPATELRRLRSEIMALAPDEVADPVERGAADFGQGRLWLLGALDVRLGDLAAADARARQLEGMEGRDAYGVAARVRGRSLRALIARAEGQPAEALAHLESVEQEMFSLCDWCTGSGVRVEFGLERFLRAELLRALGRHDEALRYYFAGDPRSMTFPVSHLRVAEIHDRRGDRARAIHHYTMFTLLWRDAGPELRPMVADAERRLEALQSREMPAG